MLKLQVKCMDNFIIPKTKTTLKHVPSNQQNRCSNVKTQNKTTVEGGIPLYTCTTVGLPFETMKVPLATINSSRAYFKHVNDVFRGGTPRKSHKTRSRRLRPWKNVKNFLCNFHSFLQGFLLKLGFLQGFFTRFFM